MILLLCLTGHTLGTSALGTKIGQKALSTFKIRIEKHSLDLEILW